MPNPTPEQRKAMAEKMAWMFEQSIVNYIPLSATTGQACANCIFYRSTGFDGIEWPHCHIVADWPDPIEPTGWCDRWEAKPEPPEPEPTVAEAIEDLAVAIEGVVEMSADETRHEYFISPADSTMGKLKKSLSSNLTPGVYILKDAAGQRWMWLTTSNGYRDRDNQHVAMKALQEYVEASWTGDNTAFIGQNDHYFWHWKQLGSISDLMFADVWNGFLVELWREQPDNPVAKAAYNFVENHPEIEWGSSQGFFGKPNGDTFKTIMKFESTTLPRDAAANLLTLSEVLPMSMKSKRDAMLDQMFKEEFGIDGAAAMLHEGVNKLKAALDAKGIQAKSLGEGSDALKQARADAIGDTADLILSMVDLQNEFEKELTEVKKERDTARGEVTAFKTQLDRYEKEVKELRDLVNAGPRRATTDSSTVVNDPEKLKAAKEQQVEYDPAYPGMNVPLDKPKT